MNHEKPKNSNEICENEKPLNHVSVEEIKNTFHHKIYPKQETAFLFKSNISVVQERASKLKMSVRLFSVVVVLQVLSLLPSSVSAKDQRKWEYSNPSFFIEEGSNCSLMVSVCVYSINH